MDVKNKGEKLWHGQSSFSVCPTSSMPLSLRQDVPPLPRWGMQGLVSPRGALPQKTREHQGCKWIGSGSSLRVVPVFQAFPLELAGVLSIGDQGRWAAGWWVCWICWDAAALSLLLWQHLQCPCWGLVVALLELGNGSEVLASVSAQCDLQEAALPLPAAFFSARSWPSCGKLPFGSQILWDLSSPLHHTCYMTLYKSPNLPAVQFSLPAAEDDNCSTGHCSGNLHALRR